jgi:hypothetical protein
MQTFHEIFVIDHQIHYPYFLKENVCYAYRSHNIEI